MALAAGVPVVVTGDGEHAQAAAESPHRRRSAKYERTTWDYDSICSLSQQQAHHQLLMAAKTTLVKERVGRLLVLEEDDDTSARASSRLRTIHQLQSLGIAYHFEEEIRAILLSIHHAAAAGLDLHSAALLFRMLREQGIPASTDLLVGSAAAFRDEDGGDGLLVALYEASYHAFPGETELEEARAFAVQSLAGRGGDLQQQLPLHWRAPRLQAMWSLQVQQNETTIDPAILQLARLDFDLVQALHRRELAEVTRWWKESGLQRQDLPSFARDRVVECFFCAACIAPEPHLADCREVLAKAGALIVHLDDIFDVYGTPDELQAFTDAIATWDEAAAVGALPEYMKAMYAAIWETSTTAAQRVLCNKGCDVLPLYKKAWHDLCKAFLVEARWHQQSHRPSFRDYLANGWVTSTGPLLLLHAAGGGGGGGTGAPINGRLVELSPTIFRLCNDCTSHQAESERGDVPSAIACCMAEDWCAGEDQARAATQGIIADTWKELNKEMSSATDDQNNLLCLNLARIIHCIYQDGEGITSPTHRMKRMVQDLLFNPITYSSSHM